VEEEIEKMNHDPSDYDDNTTTTTTTTPQLLPRGAIVVPMDGYHYTQHHLVQTLGHDMLRRGAPWSFDAESLGADLQRAQEQLPQKSSADPSHAATDSRNSSIFLPSYDRVISDPRPDGIELVPEKHDIIIVEGLYLLLGSLVPDCQTLLKLNEPEEQQQRDAASQKQLLLLQQAIAMIPEWNGHGSSSSSSTTTTTTTANALELALNEFQRWAPLVQLWDETWFVAPPAATCSMEANNNDDDGNKNENALEQAFGENKRRLVERSLLTWTEKKTRLWSTVGEGCEKTNGIAGRNSNNDTPTLTAREAATRRVNYNDVKNGALVTCCQSHAQLHIVTQ